MTPILRLQGRLFCGLALALGLTSLLGARLEPRQELLATGVLVLLLGMPHGAFDVLTARRLFGAADFKAWAGFCLAYLGLATAVVGVWAVAPTFFLCAFLLLSALHFGGDPGAGASRIARLLYGGAVIVLPAGWHLDELQQLLAWVAGPDSAARVAPVLHHLAAPWLAATLLACWLQLRTSALVAAELAAMALLCVAAPPLVAFCAYFCVMHSPRHILRTLAMLPAADIRQAVALALWPTLAVLFVAALLLGQANHLPLEARVVQVVFVGLAALTLPHMVLIECSRRARASAEPAAQHRQCAR